MAGEFIRKKWATHFEANDLDKNGFMTLDDANLLADRYIHHYNMAGERARQCKEELHGIFNSLFLWDREKVDKKAHLEMMEKEYLENKVRFVERHRRALRALTELFDENKDGVLSEEEYAIACKCWGIETLDRKFIQAFPQIKPGYISNKAFADSWVAFHTNGDESNADLERPVMFGFRMIDQM